MRQALPLSTPPSWISFQYSFLISCALDYLRWGKYFLKMIFTYPKLFHIGDKIWQLESPLKGLFSVGIAAMEMLYKWLLWREPLNSRILTQSPIDLCLVKDLRLLNEIMWPFLTVSSGCFEPSSQLCSWAWISHREIQDRVAIDLATERDVLAYLAVYKIRFPGQ